MPPPVYATDLRHFLDDQGRLVSGKPGELGGYFGLIAEMASRMTAGEEIELPMACAIPGRRQRCGAFLVVRNLTEGVARWFCPHCGAQGLLNGWWSTVFDLHDIELHAATETVEVPVEVEELDAARRVMGLAPHVRAALAGARLDPGGTSARFWGSMSALVVLATECSSEADRARGKRRRFLDRMGAKCEVLLDSYPARSPGPPLH